MSHLFNRLRASLERDRERRERDAVLLSDLVLYTLVVLAGLMTFEALIPGFVTARVNLAWLILWSVLLMLAAEAFPPKRRPILSILTENKSVRLVAALWALLLLANASLNFGLPLIPLILLAGGALALLFLAWRREESS